MVVKAAVILSVGIETKGSLLPGMPNWKKVMPFWSRKLALVSGYSSRMSVSTERRPSVRRKGKCFFLGKLER